MVEVNAGRLAALVLAVVMLGGCFVGGAPARDNRADLTAGDLVGAWQDDAGDGLVFREAGEFSATNLPYEEFEDFQSALPRNFDPVGDKLDAVGVWDTATSREDPDGPTNRVKLHVKELGGRQVSVGAEMYAETRDGIITLAFYVGDPDLRDRKIYRKCDTAC
ncbi:hypothetical protein KBX50_14790 [Micromonospora sp. C51]|uniref:hypothetical protein n=1 Tax=Micromonospora sp. C51 TaxID=2824879 RepID=UPI001B362525|nr:hypothetical protein [Micromonospora sp. C51]MBQ1049726.1 hypothetical protein [Micromonospora sp. C51]